MSANGTNYTLNKILLTIYQEIPFATIETKYAYSRADLGIFIHIP